MASTGTRSVVHRGATAAAVLVVLSTVFFGNPRSVGATTGPTYLLPPSHFYVPKKVEHLYRGQYLIKHVVPGSGLRGGALGIEVTAYHSLYGLAQFYGYDSKGYQSTWVSTLYYFHRMAHGLMTIDLLGPAGRPYLGKLYVHRAKNGDLRGQIQLGKHGKKYAIVWHKISNR